MTTKRQIKDLAHARHHKGRAGHSRFPGCYTPITLDELKREVHADVL